MHANKEANPAHSLSAKRRFKQEQEEKKVKLITARVVKKKQRTDILILIHIQQINKYSVRIE